MTLSLALRAPTLRSSFEPASLTRCSKSRTDNKMTTTTTKRTTKRSSHKRTFAPLHLPPLPLHLVHRSVHGQLAVTALRVPPPLGVAPRDKRRRRSSCCLLVRTRVWACCCVRPGLLEPRHARRDWHAPSPDSNTSRNSTAPTETSEDLWNNCPCTCNSNNNLSSSRSQNKKRSNNNIQRRTHLNRTRSSRSSILSILSSLSGRSRPSVLNPRSACVPQLATCTSCTRASASPRHRLAHLVAFLHSNNISNNNMQRSNDSGSDNSSKTSTMNPKQRMTLHSSMVRMMIQPPQLHWLDPRR